MADSWIPVSPGYKSSYFKYSSTKKTMDSKSSTLIFFVNGKKIIDASPDPSTTLLTYLRNNLR